MRVFFILLILIGCCQSGNSSSVSYKEEDMGFAHRYENDEVICYWKAANYKGGLSCKWKGINP